MGWIPDRQGWLSYIEFELRYKETELVRNIFERLVQCHPRVGAWIEYAKFEMKYGEIVSARNCYERAADELADDIEVGHLLESFADFEEFCGESERAKCIRKFAYDRLGHNLEC